MIWVSGADEVSWQWTEPDPFEFEVQSANSPTEDFVAAGTTSGSERSLSGLPGDLYYRVVCLIDGPGVGSRYSNVVLLPG